ncbi:MAG TPA: ATP-dependent Clp protease proteolytic subunit [Chloroflexia bacterium]|nr:ATP-dependent Clp protease proteolytic subunit [Chloroflexia bacterium]
MDLDQLVLRASRHRQELEAAGFYFLGDIDDEAAQRFSQSLLLMAIARRDDPGSPITVYINSGGGSVGSGIAIMEMIYKTRADYGVTIHTVVTGFAYSMGAIVFQAGDRRLMGAYSTLMLHSPQWFLSGSDQRIFNDYAVLADHYKNLVANLFAQRTGQHDAAWWLDFIYAGRDRYLNARDCLTLHLADDLYDRQQLLPPTPVPGAGLSPPANAEL